MSSAVDSAEPREKRGLSRRDMIKGAAVAGAAAWTAPVIIDSLTSPAAAASVCNKYWVKLQTSNGNVFNACPGSSTFDICDAKWAGNNTPNPPTNGSGLFSCASGACGSTGGVGHVPTMASDGTLYYKVTLAANCTFSSSTSWQIGGRYTHSGGDTYLKVSGTTCSSTPSSGSGCFNPGTNTAWIAKKNGSDSISYIYLKFCCSTA